MSAVEHLAERDSLLQSSNTNAQYGAGEQSNKDAARTPGPLEISRTARFGILAGIWMGTFLSVRTIWRNPNTLLKPFFAGTKP